MVRALLYTSNLPLYLWGEAVNAAVYIYNRTPHSSLKGGKTLYEIYNNIELDYLNINIRVFSLIAYYKIKTYIIKLEPRAKKALIVGYGANSYRLLDLETNNVFWSRDVKILEGNFNLVNKDINNKVLNNEITLEIPITSTSIENEENNIDTYNSDSDELSLSRNSPPRQINRINTNRANRNNIISINTYIDNLESSEDELALIVNNNNEPNSYKEAVNSPNKKEWQEAMNIEIKQLNKQNTWELVQLPSNRTSLKGRWVYKIKTDKDNKIIKYKARWVVKGYNQLYGIDYEETFANTYRPEIYRLLFALAAYYNWEIIQWDFKNAFTHADLDKEIYVEQPHGFLNNKYKVCKLNKALYGLKQAPRQWYKHLSTYLEKLDFKIIIAD